MTSDLIHDRGRGPELIGTRITVYNLLGDFLDATRTEADICRLYGLAAVQVAAARAYVLHHADQVLAEHLRIEARLAAGNSAEVIAQAKAAKVAFAEYRDWLANRKQADCITPAASMSAFPTFREWLDEQAAQTSGM